MNHKEQFYKCGIVVPCYNESKRLETSSFFNFLEKSTDIFFVFINDGSTDSTSSVLKKISDEYPDRVHIIDLPINLGKAEAIRNGIRYLLNNKDCLIGYWDADLSTSLFEIPIFIDYLAKHQNIHFIMGSRIKRMGASIKRSIARHYFGRIFSTAVSIILKLPVYDTQCGAKLIRRELAEIIFQDRFISRWLFDVELIARIIRAYGYSKTMDCIFELPLSSWIDEGESKVKIMDFLRSPYELLRIKLQYWAVLK